MTNGISLSRLNMKLIHNTDPQTASIIIDMFDRGIINDYSEDGWVLAKKEWYPISVFLERINKIESIH